MGQITENTNGMEMLTLIYNIVGDLCLIFYSIQLNIQNEKHDENCPQLHLLRVYCQEWKICKTCNKRLCERERIPLH